MKILFLIFGVFCLISCSSGSKKDYSQVGPDLNDEYPWIKNEDFKKQKPISYGSTNDYYAEAKRSIDSNVVATESLRNADEGVLSIMVNVKDPISRGVALCYQGNFQEAFKSFDESYSQYKTHPAYWNQVGTCYFLQGELRKAILYYHKAKMKDKNYAPAVNNLGVIYSHEGKDQEALESFQLAKKLSTSSMTPEFNMLQIYLKYGLAEKARGIVERLKQVSPSDPDLDSAMGYVRILTKDYLEAVAYYKTIPDKLLWRPEISINYAYALYKIGKSKEAKDILAKVRVDRLKGLRSYYMKLLQIVGA